MPLRSEVIAPVLDSSTKRFLLATIGAGAVGAAVTILATPVPEVTSPPPPVSVSSEDIRGHVRVSMLEPPAPEVSGAINLVFRAGGATYLQLEALEIDDAADPAIPKHGALALFDRGEVDHWTTSVVATLDAVPAAHRAWLGREVIVDGDCRAKVTGYALVARLTGDVGWVREDLTKWNAAAVLEAGAAVIAARLDGCAHGTFARDAALPAITVPTVLEDAALAKRATAKLFASSVSEDAQDKWRQAELEDDWHADLTPDTIIVRHPRTGVTWVSVHAASRGGCGGPDINVWALYRVTAEGTLATVQLRDLGGLYSIKQLIDLEGDGELELIGAPWIGTDTIVAHVGGDEVARLVLPFLGCPC